MASEPSFLPLHAVLAAHGPDGVCLVHGDLRCSWADLDRRSGQWAARLIAAGVRGDDLVAFALANGPEFVALTFGIYRAGATPAPLSPKLTEREMREIVDLMAPAAMVGDHPALIARAVAPPDSNATVAEVGHVAASWKACTSGGSTGRPKVIVDGRPAGFPTGTGFIAIPADGVVLCPGPLYHNAPFSAAVFALWRGSRVVTMPRFDAEEALALIAREGVTWALMVPTMMHRILRLPDAVIDRHDLSAWTTVVHTAAPMPAGVKRAWIDRFGADHVWEVYGATEGLARTWIGGREWLARPGSVGRPIGGALRILDPAGDDVAPGADGEVYAMPAGGPGSSYRYIGAERRATRDGWESVGDHGRLDADGFLYLADRRTDLIISGGINVWPAEVEAAILAHPAVASCAVIGLPDEDLGQVVHAVIESDDAGLDVAALAAFLRDRLAREKIPRSIALSDGPVRDDAGKVRRSKLRDEQVERIG